MVTTSPLGVRVDMNPRKTRGKLVTDMTSDEARDFFLQQNSYCDFDLPPYFSFEEILKNVAKILGTGAENYFKKEQPCKHAKVNHTLISNKDGRYAWRPLQIIHPVLYVSLVNEITEKGNWEFIISCLQRFKNERIVCSSIPIQTFRGETRSNKESQILQWWDGIEQKSLCEMLDFEYMFKTDITNCYASIYTHSIPWALHGKEEAKGKKKEEKLIGNAIDAKIRDMQYGQTNGIPQGSVLMDFIAEIVLGYCDLLLFEELEKKKIKDYKILRYRDDYRIFVSEVTVGECILRILNGILIGLGMKLNVSKTTSGCQIIEHAIKPDKIVWLQSRTHDRNLQKHLFLIHAHGLRFPNSGSMVRALSAFHKRLQRRGKNRELDALPYIGITVDIASRNPRCFPVCSAILSELLRFVEGPLAIVKKVHKKVEFLSNNGFQEIWLQRISIPHKLELDFTEPLCKLVQGAETEIWDNSWISSPKLREVLSPVKIIDRKVIKKLPPLIESDEFDLFDDYK